MKSIIAAGLLLGASAPAFAGPYANVENNAAWSGFDHEAAVTEVHAGYEFQAGEDVAIYVQGGPAFIAVDGEELQTEYSGKVGIIADVSEKLNVYGELGLISDDREFDTKDLSLSTKVGVTYRF
tara:strand:+ start:1170 stop:1541 length:372 start_codon:yes stop_codon:yes gene_type:complete